MSTPESQSHMSGYPLWSDEPSQVDLLAFAPVADTVVAALLDDRLDPVALGVSGRWGSGKTTVLRLVEGALAQLNTDESKILVVATDPWRYDPSTGAKESLIGEVLGALAAEVPVDGAQDGKARALFSRLAKQVDWAKAIKVAAKASILLQIPSADDVLSLIKDPENEDEPDEPRGLESFRQDFSDLMAELTNVRRVVVLVDDLDRCLPVTVIEALEAIRLFLAVPKMSFVIAADEERVADAIRTRYEQISRPGDRSDPEMDEEPAKLYLHKIVQTTIPVPALSRFDTQAYLLLLQVLSEDNTELMEALVKECGDLRRTASDLSDLKAIDGADLAEQLSFAERLTPILYEKLRGNPRRIKRFLNDLHVRQAIATRRGIELQAAIVAKMMVLEQLLPDEFERLLGWLAHGTLRAEIDKLEAAAGRPHAPEQEGNEIPDEGAAGDASEAIASEPAEQTFNDSLLRWAKLPPSLRGEDLSAYLHLAASFAGQTVLDKELPERLRDLAASLLSGVRADQHAVIDGDLRVMPVADARILLQHLGRMARDRPADQRKAVEAVLRISRQQQSLHDECCEALNTIPADEVTLPVLLLFGKDDSALRPALEKWRSKTTKETTRNAIDVAMAEGSS